MNPNPTSPRLASAPAAPSPSLPPHLGGRGLWALVALFAATALLLVAGGVWLLAAEYKRNRAAKVEELSAIAGMKIEQIVAWREQHISNLQIVTASPALANRFALFVRSPRDPALRTEMEEWLRAFISARRYSTGLFLDPAGKLLVGQGDGADQLGFIAPGLVARAASTRSYVISDLHRGPTGVVEMDFCTPFFSADKEKRLLGFAYFRQNPALLLFPLVQSWPTPSMSAETLLVRREGEEAVFLNHLRFREGTALTLRMPMSNSSLLAVQALAGREGLLEGVDYRGVPVVGVGRAVPGTGWTMIAKVDREEIFAPLRRQALMGGSLVLLLILSAGGAAVLLWTRRQEGVYRNLYEERSRSQSLEGGLLNRYVTLTGIIESVDAPVFSVDRLYRYTSFNHVHAGVMKALYGADIALGRSILDYQTLADRALSQPNLDRALAGERVTADAYSGGDEPSRRYFEVVHNPIKDAEENTIGVAVLARDLTARKQWEDALRESEARFRTLIDSMAECVVIYRATGDGDFTIVEFNPAAELTEKVARAEVLGRKVTEAFPGVAEFGIIEVFRRVHRTGEPELFPLGFYRDRRISGWRDNFIYRLPSGEVAAVYWDRTAEKQAEEALRLSEEKFRAVVDSSPVGMYLYRLEKDDRLVLVDANPAADHINGIDHSLLIGKTIEQAFPELAKTGYPALYRQVARGERGPQSFEIPYGDDRFSGFYDVHIFSTGPSSLAVDFSDISVRKRMEAELAAEKERLAVTLRSIGDGVIACDLGQKVTVINKVAEQMTGWQAEEAIGRPLTDVFHIVSALTREQCANPVAKVLSTGTVVGLANHTLLLARDGRELAIADSGSPIRDTKSRVIGVVLVFRDVTGKEKMDEELARAQKLESLAVLAGGIAHDFNNLLSGILGNLSLARSEMPAETKPAARLVEAERATLRARDLTSQLLTFARGGAPIRQCVDLGELFDETARFAARGSAAACRFDLASGLFADADPGQIGQVIHNLVLNAVQAMPQGGTVTLQGSRITLPADDPRGIKAGEYVRLSVRDEGAGIPADVLPRIFDPFFTTKTSGKGLGLAICHSIIKHHDGHIGVSSLPGRGTTFEVLLPACRPDAAETKKEDGMKTPAANTTGTKGRVLVMDDETLVRELAVEMLRALGYDPAGAADGGVALDLYRAAREEGRPFAAVIMDLTVPGGLGGKETIARLRRLDPAARAVVSSGYSNDPIMASYRDHGFDAVLVKPYRVEDMREVMGRVLAG